LKSRGSCGAPHSCVTRELVPTSSSLQQVSHFASYESMLLIFRHQWTLFWNGKVAEDAPQFGWTGGRGYGRYCDNWFTEYNAHTMDNAIAGYPGSDSRPLRPAIRIFCCEVCPSCGILHQYYSSPSLPKKVRLTAPGLRSITGGGSRTSFTPTTSYKTFFPVQMQG
jgi:hypothetical protein